MTELRRSIPTGESSGLVHTVLGPVAPDSLGVTLPHEHILSTLEVYLEEAHSEAEARRLDEPLTAANLPAVRGELHGNRENLLFDDEDLAVRELKLFREAGGSTVVDQTLPDIAHVDADIDPAYQTAIAARGAFVEYDFFRWGEVAATAEHFAHSDRERVAGAAQLLEAGHGERVLLSQDVVTRMQIAEHGGSGYARLVRDLPPLFAEYGVAGEELRRLMTANPARWPAWG